MGKISFLAGVGVGYVLGAAAGRQRYEQIKSAAAKTWNNPKVQQGADKATDQAIKGAKAATAKAQDAAAGAPAVAGLVDKAAAKVNDVTDGSPKVADAVDKAASKAKDTAAGAPSASDAVDKAASKVGEKTGVDVGAGSSSTSGSGATPKNAKAPADGTARFQNTDHEATGSGKASPDSGFNASNATPDVAPANKKA